MVLVPKCPFLVTFLFRQYRPGKGVLRYSRTKKRFSKQQKQEVKKGEKIEIFPKALTHGFGPKMAIFPIFFFKAIQASKICLKIFQDEKTPFQAIKTRSAKSRKIDIFRKGLTLDFGPKLTIFPTFFFQAIQARKCLSRNSRTKKRLSRL